MWLRVLLWGNNSRSLDTLDQSPTFLHVPAHDAAHTLENSSLEVSQCASAPRQALHRRPLVREGEVVRGGLVETPPARRMEPARRHARRLLAELADRDLAARAAAELRGMLMPPAAAAGAQARKEVRVGCRGGE